MSQIAITGNTYPVKDQLKALGAKWDPDQKCWTITDKKIEEARKIVEAAPIQKDTPGKCLKCGGKVKPPFKICYSCKNAGDSSPRHYSNHNAPGGRRCPMCGSRDCPRAWNNNDLCDED